HAGIRQTPGEQVCERAAYFERSRVLQQLQFKSQTSRREPEFGRIGLNAGRPPDVRSNYFISARDAFASDGFRFGHACYPARNAEPNSKTQRGHRSKNELRPTWIASSDSKTRRRFAKVASTRRRNPVLLSSATNISAAMACGRLLNSACCAW